MSEHTPIVGYYLTLYNAFINEAPSVNTLIPGFMVMHTSFFLKIHGDLSKLTLIMNASSIQSLTSMTLGCHQLDLIWSAPSPATWSDDAASRRWGGMCPFSNSLIKAVIRPNPQLPNELLSEAGVPAAVEGGISLFIHQISLLHICNVSQLNCEDLLQPYYNKWPKIHLNAYSNMVSSSRLLFAGLRPNIWTSGR